MRKLLCHLMICVLLAGACLLVGPAPSPAQDVDGFWPLDAGATQLVGYRETFVTQDGAPITHLGVDLQAQAGASIQACGSGRIAFAGRVPSRSGSVLAVTLELENGGLLTLSPLDSIEVVQGQVVAGGTAIGSLAASGDVSHGSPHVHVSLREAGDYIDPWLLLAPPAGCTSPGAPLSGVDPESQPAQPSGPAVAQRVELPQADSVLADQGSLGLSVASELVADRSVAGTLEGSEAHRSPRDASASGTQIAAQERHTSMNLLAAERIGRTGMGESAIRMEGVARDARASSSATRWSNGAWSNLLALLVSVSLVIIAASGSRGRFGEVAHRRE